MDPEKTFDRLLSARNVTWLMIFCPNLEKLCTAFYFSKEDLDYLEVHETVLSGLSKVKELFLRFSYGYDKNDRRTWWGLPSESKRSWEGNGKTESIGRLLEITDQLQSLELFQLKNRKALLKDPLFISERIKVRTMKPGEISECAWWRTFSRILRNVSLQWSCWFSPAFESECLLSHQIRAVGNSHNGESFMSSLRWLSR